MSIRWRRRLDLVVALNDWTDYGWDNAYDAQGRWTNGPMHGLVYVCENTARRTPKYAPAVTLEAGRPTAGHVRLSIPPIFDFGPDGDLDLLCE